MIESQVTIGNHVNGMPKKARYLRKLGLHSVSNESRDRLLSICWALKIHKTITCQDKREPKVLITGGDRKGRRR